MSDHSISLNKYISQTGICSRREADKWIEAGRVRINQDVAKKGNRVVEGDKVTIDGKPLKSQPKLVYLAFNKPPGITCTTDLKDKDNIIDFISYPKRIFPIGRLDKPSTGLRIYCQSGSSYHQKLHQKNGEWNSYFRYYHKKLFGRTDWKIYFQNHSYTRPQQTN